MNFSRLSKILISIFLIFNTITISAQNLTKDDDFLKESKLKDIIIREIANLNLSTSIKLLDFDKVKGLDVGLKYGYEMTPSYLKGKFARVDEWTLSRSVNPGSIIDAVTPINLTLSKSDRITFIRHFESQKKAILALPYSINKIPYNAQSTLKRLKVGDFVSIPATMSLNIGVSAGYGFGEIIAAKGYANLITSGNFNINIFRMDENKVRLKIVTRTSSEAKVGANLKSDFFVSTLKRLKAPDFVSDVLELEVFEYKLGRGIGEQYILDYIFDLSNEKAREAYDRILKPKFKLNFEKVIGQYQGREYIEDKLISDFKMANELSQLNDGVELLFQGFNQYKFKRKGFEFGLFISKIESGMTYFKNNISIISGNEAGDFFFPNKVYKYKEEFNILVHRREDKIEESFFSFIPKSKTLSQSSIDFGTNYLRKDRYFTRGEWKSVRRKIKALIPSDIFLKIDFNELEQIKTNITTEVSYRLVFRKEIFNFMEGVTIEKIIDEVNKIKRDRGLRGVKIDRSGNYVTKKLYFWQRSHTRLVARRIHRVLNSFKDDIYRKLENIIDNIDKNDFRKYFYRVVQSLVPINDLQNLIYFKLDILGNRSKPVHFKYGEYEFPSIYHEILDINRDFHDSKRDLKIITE